MAKIKNMLSKLLFCIYKIVVGTPVDKTAVQWAATTKFSTEVNSREAIAITWQHLKKRLIFNLLTYVCDGWEQKQTKWLEPTVPAHYQGCV